MYEYMEARRISYEGGAIFVPVCKNCGRFIVADKTIRVTANGLADIPNATCSKCGRTQMVFEGFI